MSQKPEIKKTDAPLMPIPHYAVEPEAWARECSVRAAEYAGMPEQGMFLSQARRFLTLDALIKDLRSQLAQLNTK